MISLPETEAVTLALQGYCVTTASGAVIGRLRDHVFVRYGKQRADLLAEETSEEDLLAALYQLLGGSAGCEPSPPVSDPAQAINCSGT